MSEYWVYQQCFIEGCTTMIRSRIGEQPDLPVCKWCRDRERQLSHDLKLGRRA